MTDREIRELIDRMERVEWREVPGVSASTAAAFTSSLTESRERMTEQ
jgi:hypothetical protein